MKLKSILVGVLFSSLLAFSGSSFGEVDVRSIASDFNSLPEAQKADIIKEVAKMKDQATKATTVAQEAVAVAKTTTPEKIDEWVGLGEHIGKAFGGAAREMGQAINDFSKSNVGIITVCLIVYKIMGHDIIHFVGGLLFFLVLASIWFYIYRRKFVIASVVSTPVESNFLWMKAIVYRKEVKYGSTGSSEEEACLIIMALIIIIVTWIIVF